MNNLLTLNFWFNSRGGDLTTLPRNILILLTVAFFISYLILFFRKRNSLVRQLKGFLLLNFFIGLYELFVTYEELPFLSARIWFIIWLVEMAIYGYFIIQKNKKIQLARISNKEVDVYKKYLP